MSRKRDLLRRSALPELTVAIFEKLLGVEHPNTVTVKQNLAIIQQAIEQAKNN
jgi:hypothetical protein